MAFGAAEMRTKNAAKRRCTEEVLGVVVDGK
jgi:hypothetical protein